VSLVKHGPRYLTTGEPDLSKMFYDGMRWPLDAKAALEKYFAVCAVALALLVVSPGYAQDPSPVRHPYVLIITDSNGWALAGDKRVQGVGYPSTELCVEALQELMVAAQRVAPSDAVVVGRCSPLGEQEELEHVKKLMEGAGIGDTPPPKPKGQEI
jgi:hypothetical protein